MERLQKGVWGTSPQLCTEFPPLCTCRCCFFLKIMGSGTSACTTSFVGVVWCVKTKLFFPSSLQFEVYVRVFVWMWLSFSADWMSTGYGYQSCSWSAEQTIKFEFPCQRSPLRSHESSGWLSRPAPTRSYTLRPQNDG